MEEFRNKIHQAIEDRGGLNFATLLEREEYESCFIQTENTYAYADDVAVTINMTHDWMRIKNYLEPFFKLLTSVSQKWGLRLNFRKCAIMQICPKAKHHVRKLLAPIVENEEIKINLGRGHVGLPLRTSYSYLGIRINEKLNFSEHWKFLKEKINKLAYNLYTVRKITLNMRYNQNLWQMTAGALLSYSQPFVSFLKRSDQIKLEILCRGSLKMIVGFKRGVPKNIIDKVIKVDYKKLAKEGQDYYYKNWLAYRSKNMGHWIFKQKINRSKICVEMNGMDEHFVYSLNMLSKQNEMQKMQHRTKDYQKPL